MFKKSIGLIIIVYGVLFLFANYELISFNDINRFFWPSAFLIFGIAGLIDNRKIDFFFTTFVLVGLVLFLQAFDIVSDRFIQLTLWPVLIIGIGVTFLFNFSKKVFVSGNNKKYIAIFSGIEEKNNGEENINTEITAIFGGADIDYRNAKFKDKKIYMDITTIFGGVELTVPDNVKVITKGVPIFGGCENKTKVNNDVEHELIISYNVIFGGIEIKN